MLVWGEEGGGSAKPVVERHVQTEIRAVVSPCPYSEVAAHVVRGRLAHEGRTGLSIDPAAVVAIDVHVHTERSRSGHDPLPPELRAAAERYFKSGQPLPTVDDVAAYYRERKHGGRRLHGRLGGAQRPARRSRTRRSRKLRARTRTC